MEDLFYGAEINIVRATTFISEQPQPDYNFKHFLFQHSGTGDGNIYISCVAVWELKAGNKWIYINMDSPTTKTTWSNSASPNTVFRFYNMTIDTDLFKLLCPPNVVSTWVTIAPIRLIPEPSFGGNRLLYLAETELKSKILNPHYLDPSPPYKGEA